jgi:hypothetical protein
MTSSAAVSDRLERDAVQVVECTIPAGMTLDHWRRCRQSTPRRRGLRLGRRHLAPAVALLLLLVPLVAVLARPGSASAATNCVSAEEARVSGSDEGPPKFTSAFYRVRLSLDASLDGLADDEGGSDDEQQTGDQQGSSDQGEEARAAAKPKELPISIEEVCDVPRQLKTQAMQLGGTDGVARIYANTRVVKDGKQLSEPERMDEVGGADTATVIARLLTPKRWGQDEDGDPIPTFRAYQITITD